MGDDVWILNPGIPRVWKLRMNEPDRLSICPLKHAPFPACCCPGFESYMNTLQHVVHPFPCPFLLPWIPPLQITQHHTLRILLEQTW
jgi:hypothetical protein